MIYNSSNFHSKILKISHYGSSNIRALITNNKEEAE